MVLAHKIWRAQNDEKNKFVFLHGMGGTGSLWRPIASRLEEKNSVLAPDQRGHGESQEAALSDYSPLAYAQDVIETMESLSFHPAWIAGHSMGMRTACALAHLRPEFVQGLILIDLGFSGPAGGGLGDLLASFLRDLPMEYPQRSDARAYMDAHCPDASIAQYLMAVGVEREGRFVFPFDRGALLKTLDAAKGSNVRGWIWEAAERGTPILVLRGAQSGVYDRAEFECEKRAFAAFDRVTFLTIEGAGHGLPFEKRTEFLAAIDRFIEAQAQA